MLFAVGGLAAPPESVGALALALGATVGALGGTRKVSSTIKRSLLGVTWSVDEDEAKGRTAGAMTAATLGVKRCARQATVAATPIAEAAANPNH